ncbi:MFS transporter [Mesoterricola sediminis]|uniref:MFS transporter n=1 Tax=Mesoterricola sediminis TaxID=2927980 RepID=A0AA48H222_9BACT|nr:MFS transporter [Mesoterricola sediminis]BDU76036.1 MFS transporter [Mesoterricola sediminis]
MEAPRTPSYRTTAIIVASALFMEQLDGTVLATALPTMARTFGVSPLHMSAALTSYLLALAMFIPASGYVADRFGAKKTFRLAILIFTLGSIACGQARTLPFLVVARFLQGTGGAMMVPVGRLVLLRSVAKADMVSAMSWFMVPALLGPVVGPPLGGWIVTFASWRWIFYLNVPIGLLGMVLVTRYIANFKEPPAGPFDLRGFVLSSLALSCLVFGLEIGARREGVSPAWTLGTLAFGAAMALAYLRHARRTAHPLLDLTLLRLPTFGISVASGALTRITGGALPFLLPLMLQVGFGVSAARSGLITFSTAVGSFLMKLTAPPILRRFGFRSTLVYNALIASALLAVCAAFRPGWPMLLINGLLLVGGFFQSLQYTALNTVAYADVAQDRMSLATSLYSTVQQLMLSMGICVSTLVLAASTRLQGHDAPHLGDFSAAFLVVTFISLLASPICARLPRDAGAVMTGHGAGLPHPN